MSVAFWKKSEDPWEQRPEKKKAGPAPQEAQAPPWVHVKEAPAAMVCPWCGEPMLWGNLFSSGRSLGMTWEEGREKSFLESFGVDDRTKRLELGRSEEAWYCTECRRLVLDIDTAMKSAGPNYVWKNGKVVFPEEEAEE